MLLPWTDLSIGYSVEWFLIDHCRDTRDLNVQAYRAAGAEKVLIFSAIVS
jgi:hypothetical protein